MTYDEILKRMQNQYRSLAGLNADDASDIGIRLKVLAAEAAEFYTRLEELERQITPMTSTGVYLDYHAEEKGISRKPGVKATGKLRFSRETAAPADIAIPAGVVCSVSGDGPVTYVTTKDGKLAAGGTAVDIDAEAEEPGEGGNAAAGAINQMVTPAAGITAVTNTAAFAGGTGAESDEALRGRLLSSYKNLSNGTNAAYYYDTAISHKDVAFVNVLPRNRGRGTVDVVIKSVSSSISASTVTALQRLFDAQKEINVDVRVMAATRFIINILTEVTVKNGYVTEDVLSNVSEAVRNYFNRMEIGKAMYRTELGASISDVEGVATYNMVMPTADYVMSGTQVASLGTLSSVLKAVV